MKMTGMLGALALAASMAQAQTRAPDSPPPAARAPDMTPDGTGSGPYPASKAVDPALPGHVVYRPMDLAAVKGQLGVLVWGNGGCRADGASARHHLMEIASHGYVVIAPGAILSGPGAPPTVDRQDRRAADGRLPMVQTTPEQVRAGLDWALNENRRAGSPLRGRIDPAQLAVAGHSCGGLQALIVGADPRIRSVIVHNSGVFTDGSNPITGITVDKSLLAKIHTPILYVLGGRDDVAWPNGSDDFERIDHVPAALVTADVGHGGTFAQPNGGRAAQIAVDWLNWTLRGDRAAGHSFIGADCALCADAAWSIRTKNIR